MRYIILYIFLYFNIFSAAYSQPIYFRHHQVEDGLANNTVFSVFQDKRGFMWFGTKEGLSRFDGTSFKTFDIKYNGQIIKEFVYCIEEGTLQTLWIGTRKGLFEFDPKTEKFTLIDPTANTEILNIKSDKKGYLWFTSNLHLYCYNEQKRIVRRYNIDDKKPAKIADICINENQELFVATLDGYIFNFDSTNDTFHCINVPLRRNQTQETVNKIYTTHSGNVLIGTVRGLSYYDTKYGTYKTLLGAGLQSEPVFVRDIVPFSKDVYWVASESGIYIINLKTGQLHNIRQQDSNPYTISDNAVYALYKDKEGGIWCGTYFGGINYYHERHSYFKKYFRNNDTNSLSGNAIRELSGDEAGNLWIGTEDAGLNKLNIHTGVITHFPAPKTISSTNIHALLIDGDKLWVGTFQQGLDVLDIKTGKRLRHYNANQKSGLKSNFIISACKTQNREVLLGTGRGIYRYLPKTDRFAAAKEFPENSYVFCLYEDHSGVIWAGTIGQGLYFYDPTTGEKGNFRQDTYHNSLSNNSVCGIFEDSNHNLWISTEGGGVSKLDKDRKTFTHFDTNTGLPSNMIYKVIEDKNKKIWLTTSRGLVLHDPKKNSWKIFTKEHGLPTDQFNYSSSYRDPAGTLYFGTVKGLISFDPNLATQQSTNFPIYITSFQVNNQEIPVDASSMPYSISFTDTIKLQYFQSSFSIGFAALSYIAPNITRYAYKMDGVDSNWTYLSANRKVYFTDLPPGDYIFKIKAADNNGNWPDKETNLLIKISPPWWLSTPAYVAYLTGALLLILLLINSYHNFQKRKNKRKQEIFEQEKEKEVYKAKIEFFTNVAHEIRTPLTLIKAPLELAIDEAENQLSIKRNLKKIERNTERLVTLTNQLLDFRRTENQDFSLSFVKVNVVRIIIDIWNSFASETQKKSLSANVVLPEKSFQASIDIEAFEKIMINLIDNAVKYAENIVEIRVLHPDGKDTFQIEVSNDGILIPLSLREKIFEPFFRINANRQGSGIGLPLARSLAQLHNGHLELGLTDGSMNIFILTLPVHQRIEFNLKSLNKKTS